MTSSSARPEQHLPQPREENTSQRAAQGAVHVPEFAVAVGTAEAADVKHLLVGKEPFHGVHGLLTPNTGFLHWQLEFLQGEEKV